LQLSAISEPEADTGLFFVCLFPQSLGGFTSIEDLNLAPGVGTNLIEANRQLLMVSAPVQSSQTSAANRKANTRNR